MGFRALGIRVPALGHRGFREWGSHGFEIISGVGIGFRTAVILTATGGVDG